MALGINSSIACFHMGNIISKTRHGGYMCHIDGNKKAYSAFTMLDMVELIKKKRGAK